MSKASYRPSTETWQIISELLRDNDPMTEAEISSCLDLMSTAAALKTMVKAGALKSTGRGVKADPKRYHFPLVT